MKRMMMILAGVMMTFVAMAADTKASFPGGEAAQTEFIAKTMVYPASAIENGIEGIVVVTFTVRTDGSLANIKVKRMIDPDLEAEAIRVTRKMPAWQPATKDGKPVDSTAEVSYKFFLATE